MICRIGGLQYGAKRPSVKKILALSSFLCGCLWLLCHISRHSCRRWTRHSYELGQIETSLDGELGYVYEGRKGLGALRRDKDLSDSQDDGRQENEGNRVQETSFHDENGYVLGKFRVAEDKDVEHVPEIYSRHIYKPTSKSNDKSSEENSEIEEESQVGQADQKEEGRRVRLTMENMEGEDSRNREEKNTVQETRVDSNSEFVLNETVKEFQEFHDQNGIQDFSRWR